VNVALSVGSSCAFLSSRSTYRSNRSVPAGLGLGGLRELEVGADGQLPHDVGVLAGSVEEPQRQVRRPSSANV
jgi:hypothetical protein